MKIPRKLPYAFAMIVLLVIALGLGIWLFVANDSATAAARAGVVQALVATILLVVTWLSIGRSDKQIEIANEILQLEYRHSLITLLSGEDVVLINLSKLPIYISDVRYEIIYVNVKNYSILESKVLHPGEEIKFRLGGIYEPDNDIADSSIPIQDLQEHQKNLDEAWTTQSIYIIYLYGGTGERIYRKEFEIKPMAIPWRSEEPRNWLPVLRAVESRES